ncbi:hypothetical protein CU633_18795 [Bacillus sp. V3-13]|nr:hypothetical protein CU633_18795 [Bacillus sp. V3-13]
MGAYLKTKTLMRIIREIIALGWHLLKNPDIETKSDLKYSIEQLKPHLKSTKTLDATLKKAAKQTKEMIMER